MAVPKVFVSSTCFDLGEVRDQLSRFISSFGFDPVLSENGDVFYHPELHTHDACLHEVSNCQLFILIIGGRFGGGYVADSSKSITNAEYQAAKEKNLPIFTFIRKDVLADHHLYGKNRKKDFLKQIDFPSIDKQEHALDIFGFIDEVRSASINNAYEGFDNFLDIDNHLRKQWAGMFFDLLKTKEVKSQIDATNHLIAGISESNNKLEELVKSLYRSTDLGNAEVEIESIEIMSSLEKFFNITLYPPIVGGDVFYDFSSFSAKELSKIEMKPFSWYGYLVKLGFFKFEDNDTTIRIFSKIGNDFLGFSLLDSNDHHVEIRTLFDNGVKKSTAKQREQVFTALFAKAKG